MLEHIVEFLDLESLGAEWALISAAVAARSPWHAVIRTADRSGHWRSRAAHLPISESEYFWVPNWGQSIPTDPV
jgi:hypothetical protein